MRIHYLDMSNTQYPILYSVYNNETVRQRSKIAASSLLTNTNLGAVYRVCQLAQQTTLLPHLLSVGQVFPRLDPR